MRLTRRAAAAVLLTGWWAAAPLAHAQPAPPSPGPTSAEAPAELKTTIDADGSYAVGTDIAPGSYQSAGPVDDGACYWKRTAGDELVDNALTKKPAFVQILPTDTTFSTSSCQTWQLTDAPPPPQPGPGDLLGQLTGLIGSGILSGGPS
ncbi:hypothetical protein NGTWS0302_27010 [Mycolicibacterium cyprinidarum]|uniref:Lipoprotein n=1 Tax=Mycolicibacterium cyprinidarum TaxID=2860311 RepID=A0ABQ4V962_9MYCO|nr:hypothetical protein NGTWS0302_27010 [Mycolicibacterium sp. NGTWS0302]GJF14891.1 hypothetical protein NGTWS1702_17450 [Mycolicibacterium sp. NGTWSNA01]